MNIDQNLSSLLIARDQIRKAIEVRTAEIVRAWIVKTGRTELCIDEGSRSLAMTDDRTELMDTSTESLRHGFEFDGLNDAIRHLHHAAFVWVPYVGYVVTLDSLDVYLRSVSSLDAGIGPAARKH